MSRPRFDKARELSKNVKLCYCEKFEEYHPPKLCSYCIQITMLGAGELFVERGEKWFKHQNKWDYFRILMLFVLSNNPILQILLTIYIWQSQGG